MPGGRPPLGPAIVDHLDGPDDTKLRLRVILEVLAKQRTVEEACAALGVNKARYYVLQTEMLVGALDALQPRPPGRPRRVETPEQVVIRKLEEQVAELQFEVEAARVREHIARELPRVDQRAQAPQAPRRRRRRPY